MPLLALIAIFIVVPIAELYVILKVGDAIGAVPTIALLALDSVLGSLLLRAQGRAVWRRFNETMAAGRVPITPGVLTDIVGVVLLLPPTRAVVRRVAARRLGRRVETRVRRGGSFDVDGTATDYDAPAGRLER
jgi:UPF0716 protein FxsA